MSGKKSSRGEVLGRKPVKIFVVSALAQYIASRRTPRKGSLGCFIAAKVAQ